MKFCVHDNLVMIFIFISGFSNPRMRTKQCGNNEKIMISDEKGESEFKELVVIGTNSYLFMFTLKTLL